MFQILEQRITPQSFKLMPENPAQKIYKEIEQTANFYQPSVYQLLNFYHSLQTQQEPLDGQFVPITTVQSWDEKRTLLFAVGLIPPSSNVTGRLLDRTASVRALEEQSLAELEQKNPDVGSSSTGDLPGETGGIATSTTQPNGPTQSSDDDFWVQFVVMCNRLGCQPEELARVVQTESGFDPAAGAKNKDGVVTAKGLIQFIRSTATSARIGMTTEQFDNLQQMSRTEQLKYVERFYKGRAKGRNAFQLKSITLGGFNNPDGSIYNSNAKPPEFRSPEKQKNAYLRNSHLDVPPPPKGYLTPTDLARRLTKKPLEGKFRASINEARRKVGMATSYEPFQPDGYSSETWATSGSQDANQAFKTAWEVANKDLNQSNLGKKFTLQQKAMINQTLNALDQMARTPPLRLLVNPQSFRVSSEKLISDGNWGRNGSIIEHWGDTQDQIEGSGKIAAFYSLDTLEGNSPGLSRTARQFSASYQNLLSLWLIYKNNGGVYFPDPLVPSSSKARNISVVGSLYLYYDGILYIGSFDNFNLTESETTPYTLEYNFTFTVRATFLLDHLNDPQYMYGKPPDITPQLPTGSTTPPLSGGYNEQPEPDVGLPPGMVLSEGEVTAEFEEGGLFEGGI
jgi:hypothetical protein